MIFFVLSDVYYYQRKKGFDYIFYKMEEKSELIQKVYNTFVIWMKKTKFSSSIWLIFFWGFVE